MSAITDTEMTSLPTSTWIERVRENIQTVAEMRGLTPTEIARELGVAQSPYNRKWRGAISWRLEDIEAVAKVLDVDPGALCQSHMLIVKDTNRSAARSNRSNRANEKSNARSKGFEPPTF